MYKDEEVPRHPGVDENPFAAEELAARRTRIAQLAYELGALVGCLRIIDDLVSARGGGNALTTLAEDLHDVQEVLEEWGIEDND